MTSQTQWENSDNRETRQIIHHSEGNYESFPKKNVIFF